MHEMSLVRELLKQTEHVMLLNRVQSVTSIHIEVGPLSGVDPLLVESAFAALILNTVFANTSLVVEQSKLFAKCRDCAADFEILNFQFRCPSCLSLKVQVTSGDELRLVSITTAVEECTSFQSEECVDE